MFITIISVSFHFIETMHMRPSDEVYMRFGFVEWFLVKRIATPLYDDSVDDQKEGPFHKLSSCEMFSFFILVSWTKTNSGDSASCSEKKMPLLSGLFRPLAFALIILIFFGGVFGRYTEDEDGPLVETSVLLCVEDGSIIIELPPKTELSLGGFVRLCFFLGIGPFSFCFWGL